MLHHRTEERAHRIRVYDPPAPVSSVLSVRFRTLCGAVHSDKISYQNHRKNLLPHQQSLTYRALFLPAAPAFVHSDPFSVPRLTAGLWLTAESAAPVSRASAPFSADQMIQEELVVESFVKIHDKSLNTCHNRFSFLRRAPILMNRLPAPGPSPGFRFCLGKFLL